jgi:glyoxylase-like metal-dependent hydrolase (beta-lactamase superfamily II)
MRANVLLLGAVAVAGCATANTKPTSLPNGLVRLYKQGRGAGGANLFWVETPAGPVLVDVPLRNSEAKRFRSSIIVPYRIYISSSKPERFASLARMREGDINAYTTPALATEIRNVGDQRLSTLHREYGDDVPAHVEPPSPAVEERTHDMVGEVEMELLPLGPAETETSLALFLPKTGELITGDLVAGQEHLDLTWGRSVVWQDRLQELKALEPKFIYPGHGTPGGPELLDENIAYLKAFHDFVAERVKPGAPAKVSPADLSAIKQQMVARFPKYGREELLDRSIAGEYAVQLAALPPSGAPTAGAPAGGEPAPATPAETAAAPAATATPAPAAATAAPAPAKSSTDELLGDSDQPKSGKKKKGKK